MESYLRPIIDLKDVELFVWLEIGTSDGLCDHGNKQSVFIKSVESLEEVSVYQFLKENTCPLS
jgi:hypothetical protein